MKSNWLSFIVHRSGFIVYSLAVVADGFDRAGDEGFFAEGAFVVGGGLFEDVGVVVLVGAGEVVGRGVAAHVAVYAVHVHVVRAGHVLRDLVCRISHKRKKSGVWSRESGVRKRICLDSRLQTPDCYFIASMRSSATRA